MTKSALKFRVDDITLEAAGVTFADASPEEPVNIRLKPVDLKLENLSTEKDAGGKLGLVTGVGFGGAIEAGIGKIEHVVFLKRARARRPRNVTHGPH